MASFWSIVTSSLKYYLLEIDYRHTYAKNPAAADFRAFPVVSAGTFSRIQGSSLSGTANHIEGAPFPARFRNPVYMTYS
jgi:hypothetical protein